MAEVHLTPAAALEKVIFEINAGVIQEQGLGVDLPASDAQKSYDPIV